MSGLDRYQVLADVSRGGGGRVVRARDLSARCDVALKILHEATDAEGFEGDALRNLKPHASLPVVRDVFFDGGRCMVVTSWIEGESLAEILAREGDPGLPFDRALRYLEQIAAALDHLHGHRPPIVHGDVKPANVLVTKEGRLVLVDLGSSTRGSGRVLAGTPGFTPPEGAVSPASDVYGLAATAYSLLTGIAPRLGMRTRWPGLPARAVRRVESALRRGLAIDPARRPGQASDFVAALQPSSRGGGGSSNVPVVLGPLYGRASDLREARRALGAAHLVTLTGRGGVGKTRLAQEIGRRMVARFPDGVWWADVVPGVDRSLAAVLGLRVQPEARAQDVVSGVLRDKRALIVFDGCEQGMNVLLPLVERLLSECPELRVLATSRLPLGVAAERVHMLSALPSHRGSAALELFWGRASPTLQRRGAAARTAAEICRLLNGIPLAVEIASARTRTTALEEILLRLRRGGAAEENAVAEAISWSMSLLSSGESRLLRRLAVFSGSADPESAAAVCGFAGKESSEVQARLWRLADLALVEVEEAGGRVRYRLHDSVRTIAGSQLSERSQVEGRFLKWFARATGNLKGPDLEREHANLSEAVRIASRRNDVGALQALAGNLWFEWIRAGRLRDVDEILGLALQDGRTPAAVHHGAGVLANHRGQWEESIRHLRSAISSYEEGGEVRRAMEARGDMMRPLQSLGEHDSYRKAVEENACEAERLGDPAALAASFAEQAWLAFHSDDPERAGMLFDQAIDTYRELDDAYRLHLALRGRSLVAMQQERYADSRAALTEAVEVEKRIGDHLAYATSTMELGFLSIYDGSPLSEAKRNLSEAQRSFRRMGHVLGQGTALHGLGQVAYREGRLGQSDDLLRRSLDLTREGGVPTSVGSVARSLAHVARLRGSTSDCARWLLEALDVYRNLVETEYDTIGLLEQAAGLLSDDQPEDAGLLLGFVDAWRSKRGIPVPDGAPDADDPRHLVRQGLGDSYDEAHAKGVVLDFAEAASRARRLLQGLAKPSKVPRAVRRPQPA